MNESASRMTMQDYRRMLERRWRTALLVIVIVVGLAAAYSLLKDPRYVGRADVLLEPTVVDLRVSGGAEITGEEIATQVRVVTSQPVQRLVRDRLGEDTPENLESLITAQPLGDSRVIRITASAGSSPDAATLSEAVANSYLQYRSDEAQRILNESRQALDAERTAAQDRIEVIQAQLIKGGGIDREALDTERRKLQARAADLSAQIESLTGSGTTSTGGRVLGVDSPGKPASPRPVQTGLLALVVGLVLGLLAAVARDRFDTVIRDNETFETGLHQLSAPVVGRIRNWPSGPPGAGPVVVSHPGAAASEDFHTLAVSVRHSVRQHRHVDGAGLVMVTSHTAHEGKSAVVSNLGHVLARQGLKVIQVDADFVRATQEPDRADLPGLSDLLVTDDDPVTYLIRTDMKNLRRLAVGRVKEPGDDLLAGPRLTEIIKLLREEADLILMDVASSTAVTAIELLSDVDLCLLVARRGKSRLSEVRRLLLQLRRLGTTRIAGVLVGARRTETEHTGRYRA